LQLKFHARQFIDAMSPFEFPRHQSGSDPHRDPDPFASLAAGMRNLIEDLQKDGSRGSTSPSSRSAAIWRTRRDRSSTENELIQLIQYTPVTAEVEKTPLLIVPPCINKYYLLDLGKGNSVRRICPSLRASGVPDFLAQRRARDRASDLE